MRNLPWILPSLILLSFVLLKIPNGKRSTINYKLPTANSQLPTNITPLIYPKDSWQYFLQHLPAENGPILDFRGHPIDNQEKHYAILTFDVGNADLQQCADALMRLRAEYLFSQKAFDQIGFHFNAGIYYSFSGYLKGLRPVFRGRNQILSLTNMPSETSHASLRKYLDIVYAYANTVSLCKELKITDRLETGTVIIFPGNPGHCSIIADAAVNAKADTVFKLVEGYMPAQSIYVLANPYEPGLNPWYHLGKGEINTASCSFRSYYLRKFE